MRLNLLNFSSVSNSSNPGPVGLCVHCSEAALQDSQVLKFRFSRWLPLATVWSCPSVKAAPRAAQNICRRVEVCKGKRAGKNLNAVSRRATAPVKHLSDLFSVERRVNSRYLATLSKPQTLSGNTSTLQWPYFSLLISVLADRNVQQIHIYQVWLFTGKPP